MSACLFPCHLHPGGDRAGAVDALSRRGALVMLLRCTCCGAQIDIEAAVADAAAREVMAALAKLGTLDGALPALAVFYLGCFRPRRRVLGWARAKRLLDGLQGLVTAEAVRRHGRDWVVTRAQWVAALTAVADRRAGGQLDLPLRNHAYLVEVAVRLSNRAEAAEEQRLEERRRARPAEQAGPAAPATPRHRSPAARAARDEAMRMVRGLSGRGGEDPHDPGAAA